MENECEIALEMRGRGWFALGFKVGEEAFEFMASDASSVGAGPVELVTAVLAFYVNQTPQSVMFDTEGMVYFLRLDPVTVRPPCHKDGVRIRIGDKPELMVGDEDGIDPRTIKAFFDVIVEPFAFQHAMVGALISLIERFGPEEINARWRSGEELYFQCAQHHLELLREIMLRVQYYPPG